MAPPVLFVIAEIEPQHAAAAAALKSTLDPAVAILDGLKAWPDHPAGILIRIANSGVSSPEEDRFETHATAMRTEGRPADGRDRDVILREAGTPMEIAVGANLFVDEIGKALLDLGASEADASIFMLGHEIHHLDELERQRSCGIRNRWAASPFAGAARPEFPSPWIEAIQSLSKSFPNKIGAQPDIAKAGAIADEAAADLSGLHWLRESGADWSALSQLLIQYRTSDFAQMTAKGLLSYDIVDALNECLTEGLPTLGEIHEKCWTLAVRTLLEGPSINCLTRSRLTRLPPLPSTITVPQGPRKLGR